VTPLEKFYTRYIFLCESGDGWTLFSEPEEAKYWDGVTEPELLELRETAREIDLAYGEDCNVRDRAEFSAFVFKTLTGIAATRGWVLP